MDIFVIHTKDNLKDKMTLVLTYDQLWNKWMFVFKLYKSGSFPCSPKSINQVDFVQNKIKNHGTNFYRPLHDLDEEELITLVENIIKGSIWISTSVEKNACCLNLQVDQGC